MGSKVYLTAALALLLCILFRCIRSDEEGNDLLSGVESMEFDADVDLTDLTKGEQEEEEEKAKKKKKSTKDWGKLNFRDLSKEWEDGDEEDELMHEADLIEKEKKKRLTNIDLRNINVNELAEMSKASGDKPGSRLMFVDLVLKDADGGTYHPNEVKQISIKFQHLLTSGGLSVWVNDLPQERIVVHINKPWETVQVRRFLLRQPEVARLVFNGDDFFPEHLDGRIEPGPEQEDEL